MTGALTRISGTIFLKSYPGLDTRVPERVLLAPRKTGTSCPAPRQAVECFMHRESNSTTADPAFKLSHLSRYFSELSPQPMVAVEGATSIVRHANAAFLRLAGANRSDLIGRPFA